MELSRSGGAVVTDCYSGAGTLEGRTFGVVGFWVCRMS